MKRKLIGIKERCDYGRNQDKQNMRRLRWKRRVKEKNETRKETREEWRAAW